MIPYICSECSNQVLRYSIVLIDENCQAAIIFNNLGIWGLVGSWSKNYLFPWQSAKVVYNMVVEFCKTTQTSGLYNYQL